MRIKSISAIGMTITLFAFNAAAAPILDQANDVFQTGGINATATALAWQQGVTAGASGLLSSIDINFQGAGTLDFFINLGAPWQTDANDFQDASWSVVSGWNNIDISSANIFINSGDEFVIGLTGLDIGNPNPWISANTDQYTSGELYLNSSVFNDGTYDLNFRTYVDADVSAVPVPAAVWLFGSGLIGLIGVARRKKVA